MHRLYFPLVLCSVLMMAACYRPASAEQGVFCYNEPSGIASLDPAFAKNQSIMWAVHQLYSTLVEPNTALRMQPLLAKSWEVLEAGLVYKFSLRGDVFFHDDKVFAGGKGRKMVAADVVYSLQRILDTRIASPGAWIFDEKLDSLQPFLALDDTSFVLRLRKPYPPILGILSMPYCSVVAHEVVERWGANFRKHPVGTGPFRMVAWEEGGSLIMRRHDRYFEVDSAGRRLPYLQGIKVSFYDSKATEFLMLRQGKLHFTNDIDASFKDEVLNKRGTLRPEWEGKLRLQTSPYLNIEYLGILMDSAASPAHPLHDRRIRQAMNLAIDRRKLILYLRNSLGRPAEQGFIPAGLPAFDDSLPGYRYDPARARSLLREANYDARTAPPVKLLTIPIYGEIGAYVARQLGEAGIRAEVEVVQKSLLLELTSTSRAPFFRGSWIADYPDAENYLAVFYSKNPAPPNYTRYANLAFDLLFEEALTETNDSLRTALYRQADRMVMADAPVIPLWYDVVVHFVQPGVKGFKPNALNMLELRRTETPSPPPSNPTPVPSPAKL